MDNIYNDCLRRGNGEPKRSDQLKRRHENRCVYCGTRLPEDQGLLGIACNEQECQDKRWAEFGLTDKQELVFHRNWEAKTEKEIADELGHSIKSKNKALKQHKQAIAKKLWVRCDRVLLARCYGERLDHMNRRNAHTTPKGTPQNGTPRMGSPSKCISPKRTARSGTYRRKTPVA
jgi:DNA-binding CsgD family transcriptional regulator